MSLDLPPNLEHNLKQHTQEPVAPEGRQYRLQGKCVRSSVAQLDQASFAHLLNTPLG